MKATVHDRSLLARVQKVETKVLTYSCLWQRFCINARGGNQVNKVTLLGWLGP